MALTPQYVRERLARSSSAGSTMEKRTGRQRSFVRIAALSTALSFPVSGRHRYEDSTPPTLTLSTRSCESVAAPAERGCRRLLFDESTACSGVRLRWL